MPDQKDINREQYIVGKNLRRWTKSNEGAAKNGTAAASSEDTYYPADIADRTNYLLRERQKAIQANAAVNQLPPARFHPFPPIDKLPKFDDIPERHAPRDFVFIFVGKMPFSLTPQHVGWIIKTFGFATAVFDVTIIHQRNPVSGVMQPKGCAYVLVRSSDVNNILSIHHTMCLQSDGVNRFNAATGDFVCELAHIPVTEYNLQARIERRQVEALATTTAPKTTSQPLAAPATTTPPPPATQQPATSRRDPNAFQFNPTARNFAPKSTTGNQQPDQQNQWPKPGQR
ncbi:MAG TPA: hypothetical protein VJK30_02965 [Coxiellaceae bacterium]|nr:MAG: hypothetical protein A3E81_02965 [Gammaproteobacteria bacterium RIFCSPHIGHO2_12_FULL_36_30]HLB56276.1 hypothetical protein [Coxiellaceae bacterium]